MTLLCAIGKKVVYKDIEVISETPKKITVYDLKDGRSESIVFNRVYS